MRGHPPPAGEHRNHGEPSVPRPAATVILLRDGGQGVEVLLVQRNPAARFMGGAWVFPGGAVDEGDRGADWPATLRRAAVREVYEETRVRLTDPDGLVPVSRWITPAEYKVRFDTSFFVVGLPAGEQVEVDGSECVDAAWVRPADALESFDRGDMFLVLPTISHLEMLAGFESVEHAVAASRERQPRVVEPQITGTGEAARVTLPETPAAD